MSIFATQEAFDAYRDENTGTLIYQRMGGVVGCVRISADGSLYTEGACTFADADLATPTQRAISRDIITDCAVWTLGEL
jgi:hypothetical protein